MLRLSLLLCVALLAGCAATPRLAPPPLATVLHDEAFAPPSETVDPQAVFALSDEMRQHVARFAPGLRRAEDPRRYLLDALYRRERLVLEYDTESTRTAAEAFASRRGNCLSLVIMTAAFARAVNLPVHFQRVLVTEAWSRSGTLQFASGHVNLTLGEAWPPSRPGRTGGSALVVDFVPSDQIGRYPAHIISEATVLAMYMNNRAAEVLASGRVDDAYWWAREAVRQDPTYTNGYNTLGVVYLHHGLAREAEQLFNEVLLREPDNPKVMGNLVSALRRQDRGADADRVEAALKAIEPYPPFHFFSAGIAAMKAGEWAQARDLFRRELRREAYYHEIHFWLAQAELRLGNTRAASEHLSQARAYSTTPDQQHLYAAKLDWLNRTYR